MTPEEINSLKKDLTELVNRHSMENGSNTPDYLLADFLLGCFDAYNATLQERARWYGRMDQPGRGSVPYPDFGRPEGAAQ